MLSTDPRKSVKLSICIATFNRAHFIGKTLETILAQTTEDCEVVVLDGGSTDGTEQVMSALTGRFNCLRYIRQDINNGVDRDYDRTIELASGEYCWLMTDDDLIKPGAVATVLEALQGDWCLIIVNAELRDTTMSKVLQRGWLDFTSNRTYKPGEMDLLFEETDDLHVYSGCVVIKRSIWLARQRERFYGSLFIHVGVIFQAELPGNSLVIATPLISYRMGNVHTFSSQVGEIFLAKWPLLIGSLALSTDVRRRVASAEPWRHARRLLLLRGLDLYSLTEYQRLVRLRLRSAYQMFLPILIALLPGMLVNSIFVLYYTLRGNQGRWLPGMMRSRFYFRNWRGFRGAA